MKNLIAFFVLSHILTVSYSQIRIEVTVALEQGGADQRLFISGSFNSWDPGNPDYELKKIGNIYFIVLPDTLNYFEYKFTRGTPLTVEGNEQGEVIKNRVYRKNDAGPDKLLQVVIAGWEKKPAYTFVVKRLPRETPHDVSIYIAGTFNNWNAADESYKLRKQVDGSYRIVIYSDEAGIEYKFTRGTWASVESRAGGRPQGNRKAFHDGKKDDIIEIEIAGWEDFVQQSQIQSIFDLLLLFSAFQGVLLIITIPSIQGYNREANRWLLLLIGFTSLMVLFKSLATYHGKSFDWPTLMLIPDFVSFIYAPLFYLYIQKLLFQERASTKWIYHFVPAVAQFVIYMYYFRMEDEVFIDKMMSGDKGLMYVRFSVGVIALTINTIYWLVCYNSIKSYKQNYVESYSYEQNLQYLNTVLFVQAACLILWLLTYVMGLAGTYLGWNVWAIWEVTADSVWIAFSVIPFFLGYFALREPNIFKIPKVAPLVVIDAKKEPVHVVAIENEIEAGAKTEGETDESMHMLREKINKYMDRYKPYVNPKLSLTELATRLKVPPHQLSRVINVYMGKNFFDFVNTYRIEEFKSRVEDPRFKNYTLLSIAFDVGFNSKTAFNRSFKKITSQTPSEFYKNRTEY